MFRRAVLVAAAAALALILAPSAAMAAYNAPGFSATVSNPSPATGQPFNVVLSGAKANEAITLTITSDPASISSDSIQIAGTKSLTKTANASGVATFAVTLTAGGTYTLALTNASGAVLSTQTVTAHAAGAGGASGVVAGGASGAGSGGQLSRTGFEGTGIAVGGGLLVLAGAGAMVVARRRKTAHLPA